MSNSVTFSSCSSEQTFLASCAVRMSSQSLSAGARRCEVARRDQRDESEGKSMAEMVVMAMAEMADSRELCEGGGQGTEGGGEVGGEGARSAGDQRTGGSGAI